MEASEKIKLAVGVLVVLIMAVGLFVFFTKGKSTHTTTNSQEEAFPTSAAGSLGSATPSPTPVVHSAPMIPVSPIVTSYQQQSQSSSGNQSQTISPMQQQQNLGGMHQEQGN